jgi:hypothetical protein
MSFLNYRDSRLTGIAWRVAATLAIRRARCVQFLGFEAPGQEDFFFCLCPKNKALHFAASKWFIEFAWAKQWEHLPELRELGSGTCYF